MKYYRGITLIELMITMTISVLVFSCLISIYLAINRYHRKQIEYMTLAENAAYVTQLLRSNIHTAGYIGCAKLSRQFPLFNQTSYPLSVTNKVTYEQEGENKILTIRQASLKHAVLTKTMRSDSLLTMSNDIRVIAGDVMIVSNCKTAEIFTVKEVVFLDDNTQKITAYQSLKHHYEKNALISHFESNSYFVANTSRVTASGFPVSALYLKSLFQNKIELAEGVDSMNVNLDVDSRSNIRGVEIHLLLRSSDSDSIKKEWNIYVALQN